MDVSLSELWELVMDREAWRARFMGSKSVGHDWATELNWTEILKKSIHYTIRCILEEANYKEHNFQRVNIKNMFRKAF